MLSHFPRQASTKTYGKTELVKQNFYRFRRQGSGIIRKMRLLTSNLLTRIKKYEKGIGKSENPKGSLNGEIWFKNFNVHFLNFSIFSKNFH